MDEIAIVGVGCLFPDAETPERFWQNLVDGRDSTTPLSTRELGRDPAIYFDAHPGTPDKICYNKNGHIRGFHFDAEGYQIPAEELRALDPLFQWTLYAARQALEDGAYRSDPKVLERCGLILGNLSMPTHSGKKLFAPLYTRIFEPYVRTLLGEPQFRFKTTRDAEGISPFNAQTASLPAIVAGDALNLGGPRFAVDAACASALYVVKLASYYLNAGLADMMLAGAVCCADHIYVNHGFNILQALPRQGESVPFDRESGGLKPGEGAGVIALKRYADAQRDGDRIYAVVENIGLSNDAGARHILVPDTHGQLLCLRRAYAQVSKDVDYIECHATGTPVGDQVEIQSLADFYRDSGRTPLLGANKAHIGHLLTASGMASIIKVLLAMKHERIPGTIKIKNPMGPKNTGAVKTPIVRDTQAWPQRSGPKRAGINAFGFGGTNAHLILRGSANAQGSGTEARYLQHDALEPLAIVGMSANFGGIDRIDDLNTALREGRQNFRDVPGTRWLGLEGRADLFDGLGRTASSAPRGAYTEAIEFDCIKHKLPPNVIEVQLLAHMSMMELADQALRDAGYGDRVERERSKNIAVIVGEEMDFSCYRYQARHEVSWQLREALAFSGIRLPEDKLSLLETVVKDSIFPAPYLEGITGGIGNLVASRISAAWKLSGPSFCLSAQENSVHRALQLAQLLLSSGEVEAVVVGAGEFAAGLEHVLWRSRWQPPNDARFTLSHDRAARGWNVGEGAGILVLTRQQDAVRDRKRIYAVIKSINLVQHRGAGSVNFVPSPDMVHQSCAQGLQRAGLLPADIGYLELHASGFPAEDQAELDGLARAYGTSADLDCVAGSVKANFGHMFAASGLASVIKTSLSLYHRYLPGTPGWTGAKDESAWGQTGLRINSTTRHWELPATQKQRVAAIVSLSADRSCAHLVLEEPPQSTRQFAARDTDDRPPANSLMRKVFVGRAQGIPDLILQPQYIQVLQLPTGRKDSAGDARAKPRTQHVAETPRGLAVSADEPHRLLARHHQMLRHARTHRFYLQSQHALYNCLGEFLGVNGRGNAAPIASVTSGQLGGSADHASSARNAKASTATDDRPSTGNTAVCMRSEAKPVLFDEHDLLEMTDGRLSAVLGPGYAETDMYAIRTRMPSPPFLFVSRITKLSAKKEHLEPFVIEWEYDIPTDAWYVLHGLVPAMVPLESSHAMIVGFSVIGCDQIFKGHLRYRALDSQTTVHSELPRAGETIRGVVHVKSFFKAGRNIICYYDYDCFVGDRRVLHLTANSGFFTPNDLEQASGLKPVQVPPTLNRKPPLKPFLSCHKESFDDAQVDAAQHGELDRCFHADYGRIGTPALYAPKVKMLSRVPSVDVHGGAWGLGQIIGETDIDPGHWAFQAHFKNDPVLPGSLIVEGCDQLLSFYLFYLGLHTHTNLRSAVLTGNAFQAKFRGEVRREAGSLRYRISVMDYQLAYADGGQRIDNISFLTVAEVLYRGRVIGICNNLGLRFVDKMRYPHTAAMVQTPDSFGLRPKAEQSVDEAGCQTTVNGVTP